MKRIPLILLVLSLLAIPAWAQMHEYMQERGGMEEGYPGYGYGPGMMGPGYGYGPGMMGPGMMGYGRGYGMMGPGMMGPGMMGYGRGYGMMGPGMMGYGPSCDMMGPGMMGPGMMGYGMMGPGMMGPGMMGSGMMGPGWGGYGWGDSKEVQKFFDATKDMRREMHMKMFEYMELVRSGAADEKIEAAAKELYKLRENLSQKAQEMMK